MTTTHSTTPNIPLLRQAMDAILANPEKHDQSMWATRTDCGTAYCYAGMTCHLSGLEPDFDFIGADWACAIRGSDEVIREAATRLLNIDGTTAHHLFHAENTTADLKHYVDEITERGRIVEPIDRGES